MKRIIFLILAVTVIFLCNLDRTSSKEVIDSHQWAQIWAYDVENDYGWATSSFFKAIELKKEKLFEFALEEFIKTQQSFSPYRTQAAYTLAKIGSGTAEKYFNLILADKIDFESKEFPLQIQEKAQAMKFMHELNLKLDATALNTIKEIEIPELIKREYPALTLNLAGPLASLGVELSEDTKKVISEQVTIHWWRVEPEDLIASGIQPDWMKMISSKEEKSPIDRTTRLIELFLKAADNETRKKLTTPFEESGSKKRALYYVKPVIAASVGDEKAVKLLLNSMQPIHAEYCNFAPQMMPDKILLKALEIESEPKISADYRPIIFELDKRGYTAETNKYLDKKGLVLDKSNLKGKDTSHIMSFVPMQEPQRVLDMLWKLHEEVPYHYGIAYQIVVMPFGYYDGHPYPGAYEWVIKNPDKYAEAIKYVLENYANPSLVEKDRKAHLGYHGSETHYKSIAFAAMMLLPEETFIKNFPKLDPKIFTPSAYMTGNYFQTDWAYIRDQKKFYEKYKSGFAF